MRSLFPVTTLLLLSACDFTPIEPGNGADIGNTTVGQLSPGTRPVPIGESGPQFEACATRGVVVNLAADQSLDVRAAPFAEGETKGQIESGRRLFVCSRSIDQRWLGVVVMPEGDSPVDCGVTRRVERRAYDGPCLSGWVGSGFVRLTGG